MPSRSFEGYAPPNRRQRALRPRRRRRRHRVTYLVLLAGMLLLVHPFAMVMSDLNVVEAKCAVGSGGASWEYMCTLSGYALLVAAVVNSMRALPEEEPLVAA